MHGLEMRTELGFGAPADELARRLTESPEQMLILGVATLNDLQERYAQVLGSNTTQPLIIVYRPSETARIEPALASNE